MTLLILQASPLRGQEISYFGSLQFATGDYIFADRTNTYYLNNGIEVSAGPFSLSASVPIILQSSPWVSYSGAGIIPSGGTEHSQVGHMTRRDKLALVDTTKYDRLGLGDPLILASTDLLSERRCTPSVSLTASVKAPLASVDRGFSTGEWDYAVGGSVAKSVRNTFLFLSTSYWVLGDLPELELQDSWALSASVGRLLPGSKYGVLASFSYNSRTLDGVDPPMQIGVAVNRYLQAGTSLMGSITFGLTDSSPDFSASLGWRTEL